MAATAPTLIPCGSAAGDPKPTSTAELALLPQSVDSDSLTGRRPRNPSNTVVGG
jgi:hypothetical protein